jgi:hypothetical protein
MKELGVYVFGVYVFGVYELGVNVLGVNELGVNVFDVAVFVVVGSVDIGCVASASSVLGFAVIRFLPLAAFATERPTVISTRMFFIVIFSLVLLELGV